MAFALATINGSDYFPHTDGESEIDVTFAMDIAFAFLVKIPGCVVMLRLLIILKHGQNVRLFFPRSFCRWWNLSVSALNLNAPLTVHPDVSIQDTLKLLHREAFDQVPVVDESG